MAQPLTQNVPTFCLACVETDNKFNVELVLKRWKYIYSELQKQNIYLMSYAADGDSRELKATYVYRFLLSFYHHPQHHLQHHLQDHFLHFCLTVTRLLYHKTGALGLL